MNTATRTSITVPLLALLLPFRVFSQSIVVEAEEYDLYHDIGNMPISAAADTGCSGGSMLVGLDYPGEWTEYPLTVDTTGIYAVRMWCRGNAGQEYELRLEFIPDTMGSPQVVDFTFTGIGYG